MQTILGSSGIVGIEAAKLLKDYTSKIRLVSRNPKKVNPTDELIPADLKIYDQVKKAVEGSDIVYLFAGLHYNHKVWQVEWPLIMQNVLNACKRYGARLVFLDNIYSLGRVEGKMTEESPDNPISKKGEVRVKIARMLIDEYKSQNLQGAIVRSADFYGPGCKTSAFNAMVVDRLKTNKKPLWFLNDNVKHSYTYTPDAAKGTVLIGNTPEAFNQIWHLPTAEPYTGKQYMEIAAKAFNKKPEYTIVKKWQLSMLGLFNEVIRENNEMLYQNEFDYIFDSSKFNKHFNYTPVSFEEGIRHMVE